MLLGLAAMQDWGRSEKFRVLLSKHFISVLQVRETFGEQHNDSKYPEEEPSLPEYAARVAAVAAGANADPADVAGAVAAHAGTLAGDADDAAPVS